MLTDGKRQMAVNFMVSTVLKQANRISNERREISNASRKLIFINMCEVSLPPISES